MGAGNQEALQLLQNATGVSIGLAYLVMFAIPILAPGEKASRGLRIASASGFAMTLLDMVMAMFPILDVPNRAAFAAKIGGVVVGLNVAGGLIYWRADRRRRRVRV